MPADLGVDPPYNQFCEEVVERLLLVAQAANLRLDFLGVPVASSKYDGMSVESLLSMD
ncbi:hypothetical protein [Haloarcula amylovorans]|uniref:hypothetical protein n=1 Tax=Haloarcula amylovorans TaxID=2562280 RepID=UPI001431F096|nr:hypothetical protein [Halomicroarcula amylolytica]